MSLRRKVQSLFDRVRPECEVAPWVHEELRAILAESEGEAVAWFSSPIRWGDRQSEQIRKFTREAQPQYGFTFPVYASPPDTVPRAEYEKLRVVLRDFADHGLRCDMNPTMDGQDVNAMYCSWASYLRRLQDHLRERAKRALTQPEGRKHD